MADLEALRQRLADLREAHASGAKRVKTATNGVVEDVEFQTTSDLERAIANVEAQIAAAEGRPAGRIVHLRNTRGWS